MESQELIVEFKPREVGLTYRIYYINAKDKYLLKSVHSEKQGKKLVEVERIELGVTGSRWMDGIARYIGASEFLDFYQVWDQIIEEMEK